MKQQSQNEMDIRLTLHYLDKIHTTLLESGRTINRVTVLQLLCSFFVIAMCVGVVSPENSMSLSGLKLGVTPWLFPYLGAWLSTLLFIYVTGLSIHETNLRILVIELYKSVNYEHESMNKARTTPYALPSIADVMTASVSDSSSCLETLLAVLNAFIGNIILIVSPIASVILAGYKMTLIFGRVWWVLTSLSLLLFGIIGYFAIDIRNHLKFSKYMRQA